MSSNTREADEVPHTLEEEASDAFVQRLQGTWTEQDQATLEERLERDAAYADAYRRVKESWGALDTYAETPEFIARREKTLAYARRANARRWLPNQSTRSRGRLVASVAGILLALVALWQFSPYGYQPGLYRTDIGEQRLVDLDDHSRIALDARTRLQVRYSLDARVVHLLEGQAQFSVAKDLARPFKVQVGDRTIVALGTVFTVEYVDKKVHVAMMEGRVAVVDSSTVDPLSHARGKRGEVDTSDSSPEPQLPGNTTDVTNAQSTGAIELTAGEELRIGLNGRATVMVRADLEAATAWREGKLVFRGERLSDAVQRLNRYSRLQIEIQDAALADREISGVFETGDTQGFVKALQRYHAVSAEYVDTQTVRLRMN